MTIKERPMARTEPPPEHEAPADDLGFDLPGPPRVRAGLVLIWVSVVGAVLFVAFLLGYLPRRAARAALEESTKAAATATPRVAVVSPKILDGDRKLTLPGSIEPLEDTMLYPRASGYVKRILVDIGDHVKEGDLLAEIEVPELDQELEQARAQLAQAEAGLGQAKANRDFSKANVDRYKILTPQGLTSQLDLDQRQTQSLVDEANVGVANATIAVQKANVHRLEDLKRFARVVAPFSGTVASRSIFHGTLVSAGNASPLFRLVATDPVRVFVQVPQDVAPGVRVDSPATVSVREYPGRTFDSTVARSAGALDAATRTMNTEIRIPNPKNELFTGMYADVSMDLPLRHRAFELPATALMSDGAGLRVAIVDEKNHVHLVPVVLDRDLGATVWIASGLTGSERVVKIAGIRMIEGADVEVR